MAKKKEEKEERDDDVLSNHSPIRVISDVRTELGWALGIFDCGSDTYEIRIASGGGWTNIYLTKEEIEKVYSDMLERL